MLLALGSVAGDDDVASLNRRHSLAHGFDDSSGFVAKNARKKSLGIVTIQGVDIRVAESVGNDLDPDLSSFGRGNLEN